MLNIKEEKEKIRTYRALEQLDDVFEYTNNNANIVNKNSLCEELITLALLIDEARPLIKKADKSEECEKLTAVCCSKLLTLSKDNKNVSNDFYKQVEKIQKDASDEFSYYEKLFDFLVDNADIWLNEILRAIKIKDFDLLSNGTFYMFAYNSVINFEYLFGQ